MNPIEFHPFEMQFEVPGTDGQTVYTRRFQAPRRLIILAAAMWRNRSAALPPSLELTFMRRTTRPSLQSLYRSNKRKKSDLRQFSCRN